MIYRRLLFFTALTLFMALSCHSQSVEIHAVVTMTDGQEHLFDLTENDHLSFEGQEALIIVSQGTTQSIALDDIRKIEFVDVTGQQEIKADTPFLYPNPVRRLLTIGNIQAGQLVAIYSIEGRLLRQYNANANEAIDLGDLPTGIYILNINNKNHKLLKL